jgi:hypothetical protein
VKKVLAVVLVAGLVGVAFAGLASAKTKSYATLSSITFTDTGAAGTLSTSKGFCLGGRTVIVKTATQPAGLTVKSTAQGLWQVTFSTPPPSGSNVTVIVLKKVKKGKIFCKPKTLVTPAF